MTRVLAIADSDSYLKWTAATLAQLPGDWERDLVVVANPVAPSPAQRRAALSGGDLSGTAPGTAEVVELGITALMAKVAADRPDIVLLGATGPVLHMITARRELRGADRPVLVTGLPGISIPATERAILFRRMCDLFIVHSVREVTDFGTLAAQLAPQLRVGLARLPFLPARQTVHHARPAGELIFAAQAKVPPGRGQRLAVLRALAGMPPQWQPVIKVRALAGEKQTHREEYEYADLWQGLCRNDPSIDPGRIVFRAGSMADALTGASAFATVSSTAALEAMAVDLPALVIDEFGVTAEMINVVFTGSGLLGPTARLRTGEFGRADPDWLSDNYFHPDGQNTWLQQLTELIRLRSTAGLSDHPSQPVGRWHTRARHWARLHFPRTAPVLWDAAVGIGRRIRRVPGLARWIGPDAR